MFKRILKSFISISIITTLFTTSVFATIRNTDKTVSDNGNILVGIEGQFTSATKSEILNRINAIRKEACDKGYINPDTGTKLSKNDYVPIKWSSDLEWIAQTRAAEASVFESHSRPNGKSCFSLKHNSVSSRGECLAWNYSGMMYGIEQWYDEKDAWVKQDSSQVTGHYESLINPSYNYVGLGTFQRTGSWITTAGEFSTVEGLEESKAGITGKCTQIIEVESSDVTLSLDAFNIEKGNTKKLSVKATVKAQNAWGSYTNVNGYIADKVNWSSSNPSVITVDANGQIKANKTGTSTITAKFAGKTISAKVKCVEVVVGKGKTPKLKNLKGKKLKVSYKAVSGAKGYKIQYATNKKFTKNVKSKIVNGKSKTFKVKKGKTYYVKVCAYKLDSKKNKVFGAWSKIKSIKIKK